jgi:hypothetical protein
MAYRYRPTLSWSLGFFVSPNSSLSPVLPVGGLDWKINRKFELQLMFPKPRLLYQIRSSWSVFAGGDLTGATFRTKDDFGTKSASLNTMTRSRIIVTSALAPVPASR